MTETHTATRKRAASISATVNAISLRRAAENDKLRLLWDDIVTLLKDLNDRKAEVEAMLGLAPVAPEPTSTRGAVAADQMTAKCFDCQATIPLVAPGVLPKECPACTVSPFEAA